MHGDDRKQPPGTTTTLHCLIRGPTKPPVVVSAHSFTHTTQQLHSRPNPASLRSLLFRPRHPACLFHCAASPVRASNPRQARHPLLAKPRPARPRGIPTSVREVGHPVRRSSNNLIPPRSLVRTFCLCLFKKSPHTMPTSPPLAPKRSSIDAAGPSSGPAAAGGDGNGDGSASGSSAKRTRSRNGCLVCRARRIKCDLGE